MPTLTTTADVTEPSRFFHPLRKVLLACLLFSLSAALHAEVWDCRNEVEVQCADATCTVAGPSEFTPAQVRFDTGGRFSVCAYSGCWEDKGRVVTNGSLVMMQRARAHWSGSNSETMREDISIVLSTTDRFALIKAGRLVLPMYCSKAAKTVAPN